MVKSMHRERSIYIMYLIACCTYFLYSRKQYIFVVKTSYYKFLFCHNSIPAGNLMVNVFCNYFLQLLLMYILMHKLSRLFCFQWRHPVFIIFTGSLQYCLYFSYCNSREVLCKEKEAGKEQTE